MYLMVLSDVDKVPYNQEKNVVLINLVPWLFWWHQKSHQTDAVTELSKFEQLDSKQGEVHAEGSHQFSNQILWKKN